MVFETKEKEGNDMLEKDLEVMKTAAHRKATLCNQYFGKYMMRAIVAGFFIGVATILSNMTAAVLLPTYPQFGKLLSSIFFSIAIILVVFIGGELFTGNNMVMAMGVYTKTCKISELLKVWLFSYVGNFIGAFVIAGLLVASHSSRQLLMDYYESFIYAKLDATPMELFVRGILCNFLVCLAVYVGMKLKSESGKMIMMFCIITAFVLAGFEHCVANMGTFSIGYMLLGDIGTAAVIKSQIFVTLGNIVGGAILLALPLKWMTHEY